MNFIWDKITEWLKGLLVSGIISNLSGLFDAINTRVGEAAAVVGTTPQAWHGGIFQMIRSLSENVVVPIAGIILTFIMCLELIQMLIDRNSLHDFDTFLFFKWIFKTFAAVLIVTNTWNIVMAVFDVAQNVVSQASGIIIGDTALNAAALLGDMEQALMAMEIGPLFGLWFQSSLMGILAWVLSICIFIVIYVPSGCADTVPVRLEMACAHRTAHEGLYRSLFLQIRGAAAFRHGQQSERGQLLLHSCVRTQ